MHSALRDPRRKRSLNELALRNWASSSSYPNDPRDPAVQRSIQPANEPDESDTLTSLPQIPDSHPSSSTYETAYRLFPRTTARHSFSNLFSSIEDFRHSAGRKLRKSRTLSRKSSLVVEEEVVDDGLGHPSGSTWSRSRGHSARPNRRPSDPMGARRAPVDHREVQHGPTTLEEQETDIQSSSFAPSGGEGARTAAAMARLVDKARELDLALDLSPKIGRQLRRAASIDSDNESGVDLDTSRASDETLVAPKSIVSRQDPADLPTELFTKILTFLDSDSLMQAELVSTRWCEVAKSQHVWKDVFRREFTDPAKTSAGLKDHIAAGGFGLPRQQAACQQWKEMWQVRKRLDKRWKDGHAAAIYLEGHHDSVYCVQFDERKIVTGSRDWTVRVWDTETLHCTHVLGVPKERNVSHQPLNTRKKQGTQPIACLKPAGDIEPPIHIQGEERHTGSVLCIDYDKEMMVTGSSDCTVIVWHAKGGEYRVLKQLRNHTMGVLDVRLNDKYIVACSKDTTVSVWDRKTLNLCRVLNGHRGPVNAVQLRGNFVVSASGDGVAKLWNLTTGLCSKEFHPPGDENAGRSRGLACVEFTHDARTIFAGGNDKKVYQFDTASGNMIRTFTGHESLVRSLHYDAANSRIVTGSYDHAVWTYDFETGEPLCTFKNWTTSWMLGAKADYRRIVAASQDGKAIVMDFGWELPGVELLRGVSRGERASA